MERKRLGKSGLEVTRSSFGALPLMRISFDESVALLRAALDGGINFYDTAYAYYDSEEKIGAAFEGMRSRVIIASKSAGLTAGLYRKQLDESLMRLRTDYIDLFQFHIAKKVHRPGEADGLYEAALAAKAEGKIRHIGITTHRIGVALEAAESGLYEAIQFPLSYLSDERDLELIPACRKNGVGLIAMKALAGGLITDARLAWLFMANYDNVVPIWGLQRMSELEEFLSFESSPPAWTDELREKMSRDRAELAGNFCRGCGYCLPCAADIEINWVARMPQVLRRMKPGEFMTPEWRAKMKLVENCALCGACKSRCPYELDPAAMVAEAYEDYKKFAAEWDAARAV
ncbi:MAG: aldo/keto reductase [Synergistaceae bacterium]|jgi:aryl-alcohol dehydrogenase-like predicted oxidoreductase|nr:aldo/keto reductase [Synergistaceae bacterium]